MCMQIKLCYMLLARRNFCIRCYILYVFCMIILQEVYFMNFYIFISSFTIRSMAIFKYMIHTCSGNSSSRSQNIKAHICSEIIENVSCFSARLCYLPVLSMAISQSCLGKRCVWKSTGGRLNIKMSSYQYKDPHDKDKTVSRPSYI